MEIILGNIIKPPRKTLQLTCDCCINTRCYRVGDSSDNPNPGQSGDSDNSTEGRRTEVVTIQGGTKLVGFQPDDRRSGPDQRDAFHLGTIDLG